MTHGSFLRYQYQIPLTTVNKIKMIRKNSTKVEGEKTGDSKFIINDL